MPLLHNKRLTDREQYLRKLLKAYSRIRSINDLVAYSQDDVLKETQYEIEALLYERLEEHHFSNAEILHACGIAYGIAYGITCEEK